MVSFVAFGIGLVAVAALLSLSVAGMVVNGFRFWPPPSNESWQYKVFWALFRVFIACLVVLCIADFDRNGSPPTTLVILGWLVLIVGFGLASLISGRLGWKNAHGEAVDLKTEGWFSYSRNPIYVASIIGMVGLAVAVNSMFVSILLLLWALMYILAPFAEEPWLQQQYGEAYQEYCNRVPRFIGWRRDA